MKKVLFFIVSLLLPLMASADAIKINGIYYNLSSSWPYKAEVTSNASDKYTGDITIPSTVIYGGKTYDVTSIGYYAFGICTGLTSVAIPNSITSIGQYAFCNCDNLTDIQIPNSVTSLGAWAFADCDGLISATIGHGVTAIDTKTFEDCYHLRSITLGRSVSSLSVDVFSGCVGLRNVYCCAETPPLTDQYAFDIPLGNIDLHVPEGSITAYQAAFLWKVFKSISAITVSTGEFEIGGIKYRLSGTQTAEVISKSLYTGDVMIPNSVNYLGADYSVTSIEGLAFSQSNITSIVIPASVTVIGSSAFVSCSKLTSVIIPEGVTIIKANTFGNCTNLSSVTIPSSVQYIEDGSFSYLENLTDVYCYAESVPVLYADAFENTPTHKVILHVPSGAINKYKNESPWNEFKDIVAIQNSDFVTITANSYTITYGDNLPDFEYISEGATLSGTPSISCTATSTSPVGTYPITIAKGSVTNYNDTYINGTLTINEAALTVTANNYTIKQGDPLPTFEATYTGFKNSETSSVLTTQPTFSCSATSASAPGTYDIEVSGGTATNYSFTYTKGTLTITDADPVTVKAKSYTITYRDALPEYGYTSEGATLNGSPSISCSATTASPVGTYPITIAKGSVTNYNDTYVNGTLTITKAALTVTANNYIIKQGDPLPTFEATVTGFKNNETSSVLTTLPTFSCSATSASAPGTYDIEVSGGAATNYSFTYTKGTLTITDADPVTVTAKSYTITYGDALPEYEYTSKGATLSGSPSILCSATTTSPVGTYPITISKGSVTNYNDTYVNGTLTINKAALTVAANNYTIKQGDPLPTFEATYTGFKNSETSNVLSTQPTFTCSATSASAPGTYDIDVSGGSATNYSFTYTKGTLTITDADPLTVMAKSYTITYGDALPEYDYTSEGATLNGSPSISCSATTTSPVGTYPITISKGSVTNYNDTYVNGTLTITKAPLTIKAGTYTRKRGKDNPEFTLTYQGFKNNETKDVLSTQPSVTTNATENSPIGTYAVIVSGAEASNYEITHVNGTLIVERVMGDANGDGDLTEADVNAIVLHIMGQTPNGFDEKAANVNGDNEINTADIVALINLIKNLQKD